MCFAPLVVGPSPQPYLSTPGPGSTIPYVGTRHIVASPQCQYRTPHSGRRTQYRTWRSQYLAAYAAGHMA
eukprot:619046-Rhodomonas_salina.6